METEMKDIENLFSDSDVENEIEDKELTDVIDSLAEEIIETLAEETVSKYHTLRTNEESKQMSKVISSDMELHRFQLKQKISKVQEELMPHIPAEARGHYIRFQITEEMYQQKRRQRTWNFYRSSTENSNLTI